MFDAIEDEYILSKMENALKEIEAVIQLLENKQYTNTQEAINWMDKLNALSCKW